LASAFTKLGFAVVEWISFVFCRVAFGWGPLLFILAYFPLAVDRFFRFLVCLEFPKLSPPFPLISFHRSAFFFLFCPVAIFVPTRVRFFSFHFCPPFFSTPFFESGVGTKRTALVCSHPPFLGVLVLFFSPTICRNTRSLPFFFFHGIFRSLGTVEGAFFSYVPKAKAVFVWLLVTLISPFPPASWNPSLLIKGQMESAEAVASD